MQNLLPRLARTLAENKTALLGNAAALEQLEAHLPNADLREVKSRIYSVAEQIEMPLRGSMRHDLWWSPHFNVPLAHSGPLVVTVHDLFHLANVTIGSAPAQYIYAKVMFSAIRRRADKVICVSQFTAREFKRLVGSRDNQIEVILNGLDEHWFDEVSQNAPQTVPYFLFVGNVKPHKNISGLIRAFGDIAHLVPHDLVIVGQRSGFITTDRKVQKLPPVIESRVKFTGLIELATLRQWYRHAQALVFPSFYEGFGFPPLEAMAMGCPAIVSNTASMPEICGDAARYCDPGDVTTISTAMLEMVDDAGMREGLIEKGLARAKSYSWDAAASQTGQVLRSLL